MKKYLIRIIGALCILAAAAVMFVPAWVQLEDVSKKDLRKTRDDITGFMEAVEVEYINSLDNDDFKDDAENCDLPNTERKAEKFFKNINNLTKDLLDESVSFQELFMLAWEAPALLTDLHSLAELEYAENLFAAASYEFYDYEYKHGWENGFIYSVQDADVVIDAIENGLADLTLITIILYAVIGVFVLIFLLAVLSAVLHVCNKGRWVKYLFLVLVVALVAGSCVAFPMVSDLLGEVTADMPELEDMTLSITVTPFIAVALMFVPVVLDIIFERKKKLA